MTTNVGYGQYEKTVCHGAGGSWWNRRRVTVCSGDRIANTMMMSIYERTKEIPV